MPDRAVVNLKCPRCEVELRHAGTQKFHEGTRAWDFLGGFWELCKNRVSLDMYVCVRCGHVEFFADGIGDALRGEPPAQTPFYPELAPRIASNANKGWKCEGCGETVPATFDVCWKCRAPRQELDTAEDGS